MYVKNVIDTKIMKGELIMKQNDLVKIRIYRGKPIVKGKNKIPTFYTKMKLLVKGEEEKGKQLKSVTLKFRSDVDSKNVTSGLLTCVVSDVGFPRVYEIIENEDGTKEYPIVWIRGFKSFEQVERDIENPFVTDEEETDEIEIEDNETVTQ